MQQNQKPHCPIYLDGGMGTQLIEQGLQAGELPEIWNITRPDTVKEIHKKYIEAGSNIILTNTFGANGLKFQDSPYKLKEVIQKGVSLVKQAIQEYNNTHNVLTALDIGSLGALLKPLGVLSFDEAYDYFKEIMIYGERAGADLIYIETISDTYELKAAVLAAKEHTSLPIYATITFDEKKRLLTGADIPTVIALLEGLRVNALGVNCGLGPVEMLPIVEEISHYTNLPIIVKPNAGLPQLVEGETVFDFKPVLFARAVSKLYQAGASIIGGCCGTTPEHIQAVVESIQKPNNNLSNTLLDDDSNELQEYKQEPVKSDFTIATSYSKAVIFDKKPLIIGERINPTGKKRVQEALRKQDMSYILSLASEQEQQGAHILDVNVGLPDINETDMMIQVIQKLQQVTSLPLQIDSVSVHTLEQAMRYYNGKPLVNSVNGTEESMHQVFPLIAKYGGVVIGLTLDEAGIPEDANGRVNIAKRLIDTAMSYGIHKKDIIIDVLALTISSNPEGAIVTLEAIKRVREELGVHTTLGVSNISFGLPNRAIINSNFYTLALHNGLSAGIINPSSVDMKRSYDAYKALLGFDENCRDYISKYAGVPDSNKQMQQYMNTLNQTNDKLPAHQSSLHTDHSTEHNQVEVSFKLKQYILQGLKDAAREEAHRISTDMDGLSMIETQIIPALNQMGEEYESGKAFLPQLLMSAEAAKQAFEVIQELFPADESTEAKPKVILATVKGDIHDIGKNIVSVILGNYGFEVIDLGKDVPPDVIVNRVITDEVQLVGLSALMTTTVVHMKETIELLRLKAPQCKVMVGGAVLNQHYADQIGADYYAKDAMQGVTIASSILKST